MKALIITVIGIILGLGASLANVSWLAVLATVVALIGAYMQYRDSVPFEFVFTPDSWQKDGAEFKLVISRAMHNKSAPTATVLLGLAPNFQEVSVGIKTEAGGAVIVEANSTFSGKVIIR